MRRMGRRMSIIYSRSMDSGGGQCHVVRGLLRSTIKASVIISGSLSLAVCFVDVDECSIGKTESSSAMPCPAAATCQNTVGSYVCRCSYGFYGDSTACHSQSSLHFLPHLLSHAGPKL